MTAWLDFPDPTIRATLLPEPGRRPYYIVAPAYTRASVGVRCLHLLAHWLNRLGQSAWVVVCNDGVTLGTNPELATPELTLAIHDHHVSSGQAPIVVYPETIAGNPLRAAAVIRYVLNFPGLLGGDRSFPPDELVFGFSHALAEAVGAPENVLHLPALDTTVFSPEPVVPRDGTCHYLGKYSRTHGGQAFRLPAGSVEIPSDPAAMDQSTIASIFRRSDLFYTYENTGLVVEAGFCGCPVVMMPNAWLTASIAEQEFGRDGIAWGDSEEEVARARATVGRTRERYLRTVVDFFPQLERFVAQTQARARAVTEPAPLLFDGLPVSSTLYSLPTKTLRRRLAGRVRTLAGRLGIRETDS
ncbi:MAG: hypothetical protein P4L90_04455 [Rhodopila sp.]|nr:hypothetical protein [Rhodopila sp.]